MSAGRLVASLPGGPQDPASAARIVGSPVKARRAQVRAELVGVGTCTHLNDVFISLAGFASLAWVLP